ncbi:Transposase and inactivated derivatives [Rodentibacter pneumotropicus]|uniref:Transposase and inactivated derivatives n=1 Tax=Rodentibacter pneumotropicus TaxID=758 RepID=A0A3S4W4E9_9PAST|nr:Transposase and inactivated derivatives [Rodentibacter pneumotropicus]
MFEGEIEMDESDFGSTHKGKRRRGAAGKVAVFGFLKSTTIEVAVLCSYGLS